MEIGAEVWVQDHKGDLAWVPGTVVGKETINSDRLNLLVRTDFGEDITIQTVGENYESIKLRNSLDDSYVENLVNLPYLHEPAILFCLQERYFSGDIYTYTGPILIALNPFKSLPLYDTQTLEVYYNSGLLRSQGIDVGSPLAPHVYAIADAAYREMMKAVHGHSLSSMGSHSILPNGNQSILISGESGAGKTESTKIVLKYLTIVGNNAQSLEIVSGGIMDKVLQSNPILEAFGNARTLRNDNSSRFGKFIELNFNKRGCLVGGKIRTYLLEKVRLPTQQIGERNFHIFYQLFAGANGDQRARWKLGSILDYEFIAKGGVLKLQNVDDVRDFLELQHALSVLKFAELDQTYLLDSVAGIVHLGQVRFTSCTDEAGEGSTISDDRECQQSLNMFCALCGLSADAVTFTLCVRTIVARDESYEKRLNPAQACDARDALAKAIYGRLFDWVVSTINRSMEVDISAIRATIGVLDIFGFESFATNSFEQLCINYTNETLQQQFNQYIFKMEQLEYEREKIEWSFIEFPDNKDCLDLIEHRTSGILAMIDDECRLPKASDEKLAGRMYKQYASNTRFAATAAQKRDSKFSILHYAGAVEYLTTRFVDKNRDELPKEAVNLLSSSTVPLLSSLFSPSLTGSEPSNSSTGPKRATPSTPTVGIQFKEQLNSLMESIYSTTPHYIRCLKPNDKNEADNFNRLRVTEQLRYGGVLEAVRVARSGFPVRLTHIDFYSRYRFLISGSSLPSYILSSDRSNASHVKSLCEKLLLSLWEVLFNPSSSASGLQRRPSMKMLKTIGKETVQLGLRKVFFRKDAHDALEAFRSKRLHISALRIQCTFRCKKWRSWYLNLLYACRLLQRVIRGYFARSLMQQMRENRALVVIQSLVRRIICRRRYISLRFSILVIQAHWRRRVAAQGYRELRANRKATIVSSFFLRVYHRIRWLRLRKSIVALQCRWRMRCAKVVLKKLKVEAKDLGKLQQNNEQLKHEIELLKARAAEEREKIRIEVEKQMREADNLMKDAEIVKLKAYVSELLKTVDTERAMRIAAEKQLSEAAAAHAICSNCDNIMLRFHAEVEGYEHQLSKCKQEIARLERQLHERMNNVTLSSEKPSRRHSATASRRRTIGSYELSGANFDEAFPASTPVDVPKSANDAVLAALEEEVSRLRKLSLEQQAVIENLSSQKKVSHRPSLPLKASIRRPQLSNTVSPADNQIPPADQDWSKTWDDEDDSSESGSAVGSSSVPLVKTDPSSMEAALAAKTFERNLDIWRAELKQGFKVKLWEGQKLANIEAIAKLDSSSTFLMFDTTPQRRGFSFFQAKLDVSHIYLSAIKECLPGAEVNSDAADQNLLLTIVTEGDREGARVIALKLSSRDERNHMLSKLRSLAGAVHLKDGPKAPAGRRASIQKPKPVADMQPDSTDALPMQSNPMMQRSARRQSVRESVLEDTLSSVVPSAPIPTGASATTPTDSNRRADEKLLQQLQDEREQMERMKLQVIMMNNDLAEKDEIIASLKKNEQIYEQKLLERENMYKQDNIVRLQLGKRLEQVLMDKEEALEQLDMLKMQLESLKATVDSVSARR